MRAGAGLGRAARAAAGLARAAAGFFVFLVFVAARFTRRAAMVFSSKTDEVSIKHNGHYQTLYEDSKPQANVR
jgi:hypothetical protein